MSVEGSVEKKIESPVGTGSIREPEDEKRLRQSDRDVDVDNDLAKANAKLANPLSGLSRGQLMDDGAEFARTHGLGDLEDLFRKGALAAQDPLAFDSISEFTDTEKAIFRREFTHRWDQPGTLYYLVILCSVAAAVQGVGLLPYWV